MSGSWLFGEGVRWDVVPLVGERGDLLAAELPAVERAVPKRVREFAAGRVLARRLLEELGAGRPAIERGADRGPVWPDGIVGTLSHSDCWCLAAVARADAWRSLGADVEEHSPLEEKLWDLVVRPAEQAWVRSQPEALRGLWAKLFFSAKESAYKCQAPLTGRLLEFADVELTLQPLGEDSTHSELATHGTFDVHWLVPEVESAVPQLSGRWQLEPEHLVTVVDLAR